MATRPLVGLAVALAVVLAGCGGGGADPTATATATPEPTTTAAPSPSPTPTATGPSVSPPGVSADGVDRARLLAAHNDSLANRSYALSVRTVRGSAARSVELRREASGTPATLRSETPARTRAEYFDERFYQRIDRGGNVSYETGIYTRPPAFTGASVVGSEMARASYEPRRTVRLNGTRVVVLGADREDLRAGAFGDGTVERFASRALVDAAGTIRRFELVASGRAGGEPFRIEVVVTVRGIDETRVDPPDWLAAAENATAG